MPTFSQHHGQITKSFPSSTEIIFKLLPSFKCAPLIPTVFGDQIKWSELQKYITLQQCMFFYQPKAFFFLYSPQVLLTSGSSPSIKRAGMQNNVNTWECQPPSNLQCVFNHQHSWCHLTALQSCADISQRFGDFSHTHSAAVFIFLVAGHFLLKNKF